MKVRIDDLPSEGRVHQVEAGQAEVESALGRERDRETSWRSGLEGRVELRIEAETLRVTGEARVRLAQPCARCTDEVEHVLETRFSIRKILGPSPERPRHLELSDEEIDQDYLEGPEMDLTEVLLEQVALETPTRILCGEDCKGLCPRCGTNLNRDPCTCEPRATDPRFQVLAGLLANEEGES